MDREEAIKKAMEEEYGYKSPIDAVISEMEMTMDGEICKAVQSVGIIVDKNELIKALAYDRDQYNKGYADAVKAHKRPTGYWKIIFQDGKFKWCQCSNCQNDIKTFAGLPNFCDDCGADMKGGNS